MMLWISFRGSRNQPSYSAVFHAAGASLLGGSLFKLYWTVKLSQWRSPYGVESIVSYISSELVKGGGVSNGARVASQMLNSLFMPLADICWKVNRRSADSNSARLLYGVQSPGGGRLLPLSDGGGGAPSGRSLPQASQGVPTQAFKLVIKYQIKQIDNTIE